MNQNLFSFSVFDVVLVWIFDFLGEGINKVAWTWVHKITKIEFMNHYWVDSISPQFCIPFHNRDSHIHLYPCSQHCTVCLQDQGCQPEKGIIGILQLINILDFCEFSYVISAKYLSKIIDPFHKSQFQFVLQSFSGDMNY